MPVADDTREAEADRRGGRVLGTRLVAGVWLLWAVLRVLYFIGDYMEDAPGFAANATSVAAGEWEARTDLQGLRIGTYLPAGLAMYLFGRTELALALWPLLSSALGLAALFGIGRQLGLGGWTMTAAVLWASYPGDVLFSTVLMPDAIQAGWLLVTVYLLIAGTTTRRRATLIAAGLAAGVAYLVRENFMLVAPVLFGAAVFLPQPEGTPLRSRLGATGHATLGLAVVILGEGLFYWVAVGDPLHRLAVSQAYYGVADAIHRYGLHADYSTIPLTLLPPFEWMRGTLAPFTLNPGQSYHAYVFVLAVVGWIAVSAGLHRLTARDRAVWLFLSIWLIVPVLYHQFGSQSLTAWVPMHRLPRQLVIYGAPAVLLVGWSLSRITRLLDRQSIGRKALAFALGGALAAVHAGGVVQGLTTQARLVRETTDIHDRLVAALAGYSGRVHVESAEIVTLDYFLNAPGRHRVELRDLLSVRSCDELAGSQVITGSNPGWAFVPKPDLIAAAAARLPCLTSTPAWWRPVVAAPWLPERIYLVPPSPRDAL